MGVDLDRVGGDVITNDDGRRALPDRQLGPDIEVLEVGLGLRPPNVQQMTGVIEGVAGALDASAGATGVLLLLQDRSRQPRRRQPLTGDQPGQSTTDDDRPHAASMSTRPSQISTASTTTATTAVTMTVVSGSRRMISNPTPPSTAAAA